MTWLSILAIVVLLVAVVSVFGLAPRGAEPVAGTRLMTVARLVLVFIGLLLLYFGCGRS
jgi:hypothetical protein